MKIVFFGTPPFAATILEALLKERAVAAVVTKPDKPRGRSKTPQPSAVKECALRENLPLYQPALARDPAFIEEVLRPLEPDLFIVAAYSEIFRESLLDLPKFGCINVHASLLPKYRGAAPIQRCMMAGDQESGVTIMSMRRELDAGEILAVSKVKIPLEMNAGELTKSLAKVSGPALLQVLDAFEKGTLHPMEQDLDAVTYAPKVHSKDGQIDWTKDAFTLHNHVRALTPKPGAWTKISMRGKEKRVRLLATIAHPEKKLGSTGEWIAEARKLFVGCGVGQLEITLLQMEGKRAMPAADFLRGFRVEDIEAIF